MDLITREVAVEALFRQTGILRAETLKEMLDLAAALSSQPLPAGRRVGVVTNAGGPAILCADRCEAGGLEVPELSATLRTELAAFLPPTASLGNPIDLIASASPEQFQRTLALLLRSGEVDALIVIYVAAGLAEAEVVGQAVQQAVAGSRNGPGRDKPVLACWMPDPEGQIRLASEHKTIPCYAYPEEPAQVLSQMAAYATWRARPLGCYPLLADADTVTARAICQAALAERGRGWLRAEETRQVLQAMRLPVAAGGVARTPEEAAALARSIGFPVAVKLASHELVHKTELGVIHLDLRDEAALVQAFHAIRQRLAQDGRLEAMEGVLVQPMISGGTEVMVGVTQDPLFGPLIAFGLGGIHVEILGDVCFRVTPLTDRDASEMVRSLRGARLLEGYRGHPPADVAAIEEVLLRVSRLVDAVPELHELDLNPVFVLSPGQGCRIVDARLWVEPIPAS